MEAEEIGLRPTARHQLPEIVMVSLVVAAAAAVSAANPRQLPWALATIALTVGAFWYGCRHAQIVVTQNDVISVDVAGPARRSPRVGLACILISSYWIFFVNDSGTNVLRTRKFWTREQLEQLAEVLQVPIVREPTMRDRLMVKFRQ